MSIIEFIPSDIKQYIRDENITKVIIHPFIKNNKNNIFEFCELKYFPKIFKNVIKKDVIEICYIL